MKNDELLHKWVNGDLTAKELEQFQQRPEYEELKTLHKNTESLKSPDFDEEAMLQNILTSEKESKPESTGRRIFLNRWLPYGIAASILLIGAWFLLNRSVGGEQVIYQIAKGEQKEAQLPDGSTFALNAESRLVYDAKNWENNRNLKLEGEAFFDVQKGSTFEVMTPNGTIQVLGTQFNVRSRKAILDVQCKSGKVAVLNKQGKTLATLTASQAVRVQTNKISEQWQLSSPEQADWTKGIFSFKNVPLTEVMEELERQFNISFLSQDIEDNQKLTCNFQNKNLEQALKTTLGTLGIQYQIKGDRVTLSK